MRCRTRGHAPSAHALGASSYRNFRVLVAGWVHCLGRRTITAVTRAAGAVGQRHISVFHRFFARAEWALDDLGRVLFRLAVPWIPAEQPLYVLIDDTLARKGGKGVALASMRHDPLLSTARKPFFSFGHVWVALALWVPLPMGGARGFALPLLIRLYVGSKRGGQLDAPSRTTAGARLLVARAAHPPAPRRPTKLELAREMIVEPPRQHRPTPPDPRNLALSGLALQGAADGANGCAVGGGTPSR